MLQSFKSFFIFSTILALGLTGCGDGGGNGANGESGDNGSSSSNTGLFRSVAAERTPDELDGTWAANIESELDQMEFRIAISEDDRISLGVSCEVGDSKTAQVQVTVKAKITNDTIELLENAEDKKKVGDVECTVTANKGYIVAYRLNAYELTIIDNGEEVLMTKISD